MTDRPCKIIDGWCEHLQLHTPESLCKVCTRWPGAKVWPRLIAEREAADKKEFTAICKQCHLWDPPACNYSAKKCQIGKTGSVCPLGLWKGMTFDDAAEIKANNP